MRRNETERLCLIVNPRSAGGATGRKLAEIRAAAERWFARCDIWLTEHPAHAIELATRAADDGYDLVGALGGDGTANEVVNGLLHDDRPRNPSATFVMIPGGTGSDLIRTLGIPNDVARGLGAAACGETRPTDAYVVEFESHEGLPARRYGINVTSFGVSGDTVRRANLSSKRLGGTATFLASTISAVAHWAPPATVIEWTNPDGSRGSWEGDFLTAFLCNGQFCGGGMWLGRGAKMDDGLFNMILIPRLSAATVIRGGRHLYTGHVEQVPGVRQILCRSVDARLAPGSAAPPMYLDTDGEQPGVLPMRATVLPKALRVRALWTPTESAP
jgi:diacylglycerol kinase (ATP)